MSKRVSKLSSKAKEASSSLFKHMASKKKGKAPVAQASDSDEEESYDSTLFVDKECYVWYTRHKSKMFVVEKTISPTIDEHFNIISAFATLGWQGIFKLHGEYYPDLVLQFYANIERKGYKRDHFTTMVKGVPIEITPTFLAKHFKLPEDGLLPQFSDHQNTSIENNKDWSIARTIEQLNIPYHDDIAFCRHMEIRHRLVAYFFQLMSIRSPVISTKLAILISITWTKFYLVLSEEESYHWLSCLLQPCWVLLLHTRHQDVRLLKIDVKGERVLKTTSKDVVNEAKLTSFHYRFNGHFWSNPHRLTMDDIHPPADEEDSANSENEDHVEAPPLPKPKPGRPLTQHEFQSQMLNWMEKQEKNYAELQVHVEDIRETQLTHTEQIQDILKFLKPSSP